MRVLTWNLFHGRSVPGAGRSLLEEFAGMLAGWDWDVALLQEVPPWWPAVLASRSGAECRRALTSRNGGLVVRRVLAEALPDVMRSNGGGSNCVLVRGGRRIARYEELRLRWWPERRVAQMVGLQGGMSVVNMHASTNRARAREELVRCAGRAVDFAGREALVLGGDLNLVDPRLPRPGFRYGAGSHVDHLLLRGLRGLEAPQRLEREIRLRGRRRLLSDHAPLLLAVGHPEEAAPG